jgi:serine-type D-Ala-D-Ala carboxypeptidase/endopeptidase (penicillin-binding protein 4)
VAVIFLYTMARSLLSCLFVLALLSSPFVRADPLPEQLSQALIQSGLPDSHIGLLIQDLAATSPELAHGEGRSLNPASVMKLLTTLVALDTFGPAHSFKTSVLLDGTLSEGILHGNLILRGGGARSYRDSR